mgnify:CR=1 FL=1
MPADKANASQTPYSTLSLCLGYLGLIPFFIPLIEMIEAVSVGVGIHGSSIYGLYAPYVFIAYSAVILSFLSGVLWSKGRFNLDSRTSRVAIIFSNLVALSAWTSLIIINISSMLTMFAVALLLSGYGSLLLAERSLDVDSGDSRYWRMRLVLTMLVIATHSVVLVFLIREF